jgi:hypothetical protein
MDGRRMKALPNTWRRSARRPASIFGLAVMLMGTTTSFGDATVDLKIYNDTADQVVVTLYDMNATPPQPVLERQIIEGFAWFPASVTPGIDGNGHVRWSAETTGTSFHRCGHRERRKLTGDSMVRIFTDSRCRNP